jgi:hypothetical protein
MRGPGKYTIQLQEGKVKSNIVMVTVEPKESALQLEALELSLPNPMFW